ncbi:MAG: hypothetical protein KGH66_01610 [Candidatus Micrarchaeota archaeon]|nr:hypothetical protein [Candidatus Micrarchaeota archaeon]
MSFEETLEMDARDAAVNGELYYRGSKPRPNMSRSAMDADRNGGYVELGSFEDIAYHPRKERYLAVINLTYDAIISLYNVDSRELGVCRFYRLDDSARRAVDGFLRRMSRAPANIEVRLIGFQNGQDAPLHEIMDFVRARKLKLVEIDLFGPNVRHVSMDSMLGSDFDLLLEDRIYRPGELKNTTTLEQFERAVKK